MRRLVLVVSVALLLQTTMADPNNLAISQASNAFASQLYQELAKTPGNVLVCPLSAHIALTLVHQGAGGNTGNELGKALHLAGSNDNIKNNYKTLLTGLQDDVLKIATKLYPATSFTPKPDYVIVAKQYFLSDVESLDYSKAAEAAKTINTYVENKTNNKIHDIIKPASLSDLTRLVIINAVHFKATWAKTFPPAFSSNFKVTPTEVIKTDFLSLTDHFPYKEDRALGAKVLKMDYEGGKYSMVFVLPIKEDGLQEVEHKLANTSMDSLLSDLREQRVETTIPKFKIEQEMQLKDTLMKMGINSIFDSRANLSNLAQGENLFVDSVIQKTFIDVNEKGTEAAAATGVVEPLSGVSEDNIFFARRPFVYYLVQNLKFVIIFNGRLVRPKASQKIPPKMSSPPKRDNNIGNTKLDFYNGIGNVNRFMGNGQVSFGNNQGFGMKPNAIHTYGQNPSQQGLAQIPGQIDQVNGFNPNRYPVPERPQLVYGQNIGSNIRHEQQKVQQLSSPQNYEQHSPVDRFSSDGYSTVQSQSIPSNNRGIQRPQNQQQPPPQNYYYPQYETYG